MIGPKATYGAILFDYNLHRSARQTFNLHLYTKNEWLVLLDEVAMYFSEQSWRYL